MEKVDFGNKMKKLIIDAYKKGLKDGREQILKENLIRVNRK